MNDDAIFTINEIAKYLKCSVSTIRNLIRNNKIPHFRIGVKLYFKQSSIKEWVNEKERKNYDML